MIEELLKIIFTADKLIAQYQTPDQNESNELMVSCVQELEEIDEKIYRHFQEKIEW